MEKEIWKDIPNYEGLYLVSSYGRIKSFGRNGNGGDRIMSQQKSKGYWGLKLCKDDIPIRFTVHRLVCLAFYGKKPKWAQCINHKDGNKENNFYKNLEYTTFKENTIHAVAMGLCENGRERFRKYSTGRSGILNHVSKPVIQIDPKTGHSIKEYVSATFAHNETGINRQCISSCCTGGRGTAGGYIWKHKKK